MVGMSEPAAGKEIAAAVGMESKAVSCKLTGLKNKGYIDSPVRCKYAITAEGKAAL
ncbi:MAG: MarR family transcriptional regulator [Proteobacteria bacterium]|nr:MarR family transcriptional regulator [Pseudomonadota bacterium]MBU1639766.1 MarR family transcriptional regulator [Pseudomonadota bacterium]